MLVALIALIAMTAIAARSEQSLKPEQCRHAQHCQYKRQHQTLEDGVIQKVQSGSEQVGQPASSPVLAVPADVDAFEGAFGHCNRFPVLQPGPTALVRSRDLVID